MQSQQESEPRKAGGRAELPCHPNTSSLENAATDGEQVGPRRITSETKRHHGAAACPGSSGSACERRKLVRGSRYATGEFRGTSATTADGTPTT